MMQNPNPKKKYLQSPVRPGCYVEFVDTFNATGYQRLVRGYVVDHYYDEDGHHFFTISDDGVRTVTTTGARIYENLVVHHPGEVSRIELRRAKKRDKKRKKRMEQTQKRRRSKQYRKTQQRYP